MRAGGWLRLLRIGVAAAATAVAVPAASSAPQLTLGGVVIGDVRSAQAVLWARPSQPTTVHVRLSGGRHARIRSVAAAPARDLTAQIVLTGLEPATRYRYRVSLGASRRVVARGLFRTAPRRDAAAPMRLAFGGDLAGQNVCRDAAEGFPIANTIRAWRPDIFVGLGDMVYADDSCGATGRYGNVQVPTGFGPATDLAGYLAHWRYNRADPALERLLRSTNYVGVWDDHEIVNDSGPVTAGDQLGLGLRSFFDYTPIAAASETPNRVYRKLRYGHHLDLFVLDTRQYRDANFRIDDPRSPKTMLGREQLAWLEAKLATSNATWKVIVSSVPMSIPTGFPPTNGRDGWANFDQQTGYEYELLALLRFLQQHHVRNLIFITTDVHFSEGFRYTPFVDDPAFQFYELVTGPMNAGIFPTTSFDTTLNPERLFLYAPESANAVTSWEQAKRWFNFGALAITAGGGLTAQVVNTSGDVVHAFRLRPSQALEPRRRRETGRLTL